MFADDTELYKSDSPSEAFTFSRTIEACISDVKVWIVQNKLKLNDDKTEILLIGSAPGIDLPSSVRVGHSDISFSSAARNLGVIIDSELALSFPLLFSLGLIIAMLSLLAVLRFLIKSRE